MKACCCIIENVLDGTYKQERSIMQRRRGERRNLVSKSTITWNAAFSAGWPCDTHGEDVSANNIESGLTEHYTIIAGNVKKPE